MDNPIDKMVVQIDWVFFLCEGIFFPMTNPIDKMVVEDLSLVKRGLIFFPVTNTLDKRVVEVNLDLSLVKSRGFLFFPVTNPLDKMVVEVNSDRQGHYTLVLWSKNVIAC